MPSAPAPDFSSLPDLALGGSVLFATDDFFAVAENLISKPDPVWDEKKFTEYGWETRRKRIAGHDWAIIKLGFSGIVKGVDLDTAFFTGNYTPRVSIQAACLKDEDIKLTRRSEMGTAATAEELAAAEAVNSDSWEEILPMVALKSGTPETRHNLFRIDSSERWTHLRINYYPDGGVARLRVLGEVVRDWSGGPNSAPEVPLGILGKALSWSDAHYGKPSLLISPGDAEGMYDGWETARNPERPPEYKVEDGKLVLPGSVWAVLKLGHAGSISKIEVDTTHFKGNFPESCTIEGCLHLGDDEPFAQAKTARAKRSKLKSDVTWFTILERTKLEANKKHTFDVPEGDARGVATHVRLTLLPDGGVGRLRLHGTIKKYVGARGGGG
ncbi:Allantoicase domain-containing protein [Blyttiomyces helicus]|uniref:Allantoicase domain-containing protein n=1 Tax=Blyttiomyces helicus TaxID=388810 RepID=A0A4V1IQU4_9FUNG|nr:Allantoicase domain-containing protein [Blyttiomyces helicus]|eukprot:RKO87767.1 Allantoicase domain-containing protein [Blyttiomyces helicus]